MKTPKKLWFIFFLSILTGPLLWGIVVDKTQFNQEDGFKLVAREDGLIFTWETPEGTAFIDLQITPIRGKANGPLIKQLGVDGKAILSGLDPNYLFWVGDRDLEKRPDGWMIFFDRVPTRPYSVEKGFLAPERITVSTEGKRAVIELDGLASTHFLGSLVFIFYDGSPFVHMEARVSTQRPATAFLYHVGLSKPNTEGLRLNWIDSLGNPKSERVEESTAQVYKTRFRSLALSSEKGSLAISPFPHQFLYPLDFVENYGYNWAGDEYLDMIDGFSFGVRQPPIGDRRYVPWVNAPPGTEQKLGVLLFVSNKSGHQNLDTVRSYTRNDTFKPLEGYKTFSSHYHVEHSLDYIAKQAEQKTEEIPNGLTNPEFVDFFKRMGVDIVHLAEFHRGTTPRLGTIERLEQLKVMHDECARLSGEGFLLLPGEEPNVHFGGHWLSFFPKPVNWVLNQNEGQPFVQELDGYGKVYHVGSPDDVLKLLEIENGLAWTAHARIKSSTGFPDAYNDTPFFKSDRFLGAAWKAMPADYSRDTLGWRVLDLLDDMANWGAPKYVMGEVDIFKIFSDYELFGAMNINYMKMDTVPDYEDGWQPVLDVLRSGSFFVTTGEVLIPECSFGGKESGETLSSNKLSRVALNVDLEWTYPLSHLEVVSGDGSYVFRERINLFDTQQFGKLMLERSIDLSGRKWARIEVWDIARNGAFTQPVWIK
jgi:hypothetical protein